MGEALEKLGGSVMNLVLGALIVWVGQTTFQHAGILASVSEKFENIDQQFVDIDKRQESLKKSLDLATAEMKESIHQQYTAKEGQKLDSEIRQMERTSMRQQQDFAQRIGELEIRLATLQTYGQNLQHITAMQAEITQLRFAMSQAAASAGIVSAPQEMRYQPATSVSQQPVYLPPVTGRR
jgi:hypothetical protein